VASTASGERGGTAARAARRAPRNQTTDAHFACAIACGALRKVAAGWADAVPRAHAPSLAPLKPLRSQPPKGPCASRPGVVTHSV